MNKIHDKLRDFKFRHPYLFMGLDTFTVMLSIATVGLAAIVPILLVQLGSLWFLLSWFITVPLAIMFINLLADCFSF